MYSYFLMIVSLKHYTVNTTSQNQYGYFLLPPFIMDFFLRFLLFITVIPSC